MGVVKGDTWSLDYSSCKDAEGVRNSCVPKFEFDGTKKLAA